MKAISKGSLAGCLVHLDAGSTKRLAQQNLQISEHANDRTLPSWLKKFEKLHSDKMKTTRGSHRPALGEVPPFFHQSKPGLTLKSSDWKSWTYTMLAAISRKAKQVLGQGSTTSVWANLS